MLYNTFETVTYLIENVSIFQKCHRKTVNLTGQNGLLFLIMKFFYLCEQISEHAIV